MHYFPVMDKNDLFYQIALTLVPKIGAVYARILTEKLGDAKKVFHTGRNALEKIAGTIRAENILCFNDFARVEKELAFIDKAGIRPLFLTDPDYPQRLLNCSDPPLLLFYKGKADLNASQVIAVVGTRTPTDYGKQATEKLIKEFTGMDVLVVSGLAYGIDATAHKTALTFGLKTVGVLGHGLDSIYPPAHRSLTKDILEQEGGLLTEFRSATRPEKHNFPARNRIVAGMSDATVIVETDHKGGSIITAELANTYNKDVFAYPGKTTDVKSRGCNNLIKTNKAVLLTNTQELLQVMKWANIPKRQAPPEQIPLYLNLDENEQKLAAILREKATAHIDELTICSGLSSSQVSAAILTMELQRIIRCLPGKRYTLASSE